MATTTPQRELTVIADDYGIGPNTSAGIRDLAAQGLVTGTVLLVNAPDAEDAVRQWERCGRAFEMGWHPCLTLDRPILCADAVPSLVETDGRFPTLDRFVKRWLFGGIRTDEVHAEFMAQHARYIQLTGMEPRLVNAHHHVNVFGSVGAALRDVLRTQRVVPYVRRVRESFGTLVRIPGVRLKRALLATLGRHEADRQHADGFPGADLLAGITDPPFVSDAKFFTRWLTRAPGMRVELTCHPGRFDRTLDGRDGIEADGQMQRRVREYELLSAHAFREAIDAAGFRLVSPTAWLTQSPAIMRRAA